ncbi:hypothetical protein WJX73_009595 [Symbiochloris irregularis]|uniref:N-acetyltransferase domain-containing protein n=1 Tax=Symbiochloris irregularis TaxID=706552 RepID=A0AAW1NSD0_9CHLO
MCAEAFIAEAPQDATGSLGQLRLQGQQALLKYAERTLSAQIYKGFTAKRKAQRERRAARMETQAAQMRAELARLSGDGGNLQWPSAPSTIQRRTEQRQRTAQHFISRTGPIVGCALITLAAAEAWLPPPWPTKAPQRAYVGNMACLPSWRRRGVASALLRRCERVAAWWQYDSVWLHTEVTNSRARRLYRSAGYRVARQDPWFYGAMQQVLLSKSLRPHGRQKRLGAKDLKSQQSLSSGQSTVEGTYVWNVKDEHSGTALSGGFSLSSALKGLVDIALHLDKHLGNIIARHHQRTYYILFAIVFAETGFVLTPFLPGDSLLFAAGAFATPGSPLRFPIVLATFIAAAILGDAVNYAIGSFVGEKAMSSQLIKKEYIDKTQKFYVKYGGKTLVLARFVPIVRTFAPFIAGVARMSYAKFAAFNVGGALLWTILFTGAGYYFGNLPFVKHNFTLVILAIVLVSVVPVLLELYNERNRLRAAARDAPAGGAGSSA